MKKKQVLIVSGLHMTWKSKLFLTMRLTLLALLLSVFQGWALSSYSQNTKLSLKMENATIKEVLYSIEEQSDFFFLYNSKLVDVEQNININVQDQNIKNVLNQVLAGTEIDYEIVNRQILLSSRSANTQQVRQIAVSGRVVDAENRPLPGVTVVVKGTTQGTISDTGGNYSLLNVPGNATLVFSFVGMKALEISVGGKTSIDVAMQEETFGVEEVVVIGFGTQKKVNLTGSVSAIGTEMLEMRPVSNVVQSLQGLVPGLNITQNTGGEMGRNPTINIRGITTIGQGSSGSPLILIDGMEGDINTLSPQDIDNISVLKDAASSSIYGSRAPFGVILITTKKGKSGKAQVSYTGSFRSNSPILIPHTADSYKFALYFNDMQTNSGRNAYFGDEWLQRIKDFQDGKIPPHVYNGKEYPMTTIADPSNPNVWAGGFGAGNDNVDWYKALYHASVMSQEHALSASGGNENVNYYASVNYLDHPGLMKLGGDQQNRFTVTGKINAKLSEKASITYISRFTRFEFDQPSSYRGRNDFWFAEQAWPMLPLYDPNGYYLSSPSAALFIATGGREEQQNDKIYQQLQLTIEPLKGWKIFGDINYSIGDNFHHLDQQKMYNHDVQGNPILYSSSNYVVEDANRANFFNPNVYTEYSNTFGNHFVKVMAGFQSELYKYRSLLARREGIIVPSLPVINITSGTDDSGKAVPPQVSGDYLEWATAGYFGRLNYNYKERYLFELNLRYDGTSRFRGEDKRWNLFPSASVGWNIARETFWGNLAGTINNLKIRGSYGELGNQNTSSYYPTYSVMGVGTANGRWLINGARPNTASAPGLISSALTWEKIRTYNIGVDIGLFNNKLSATMEYYVRFTDDMVGPAPELPVILGTGVPRTNNTNLKTYGFELDLGWQDRLDNGLAYNVHFTLSDSRTKILKYPNSTGSIGYQNIWQGAVIYDRYRDGETYGEIWGYTTIGIAKTAEEMNAHLASLPNGGQDAFGTNWGAGDIMYKDLNNDGKISKGSYTVNDPGDLSVIGNITPRYLFGLNLGADWKGFDFTAFFQGIMKRDYFNRGYMFWGAGRSVWESTALVEHLDYFRKDPNHPLGLNVDSYYPRPDTPENWSGQTMGKNHEVQTRYLQNASYIRLKNLTIGYTLPKSITNKVRLQKVRLYLSGENLWTGTKLTKIFDPELIDNPGNGGNTYPLSKVYSFGVNLNF